VQSPLLAKLAEEADGAFRLARVNVDEQPKLAERLKVKSVPTVKAFVDGRIVSEFTVCFPNPTYATLFTALCLKLGPALGERKKLDASG
jgi:thioredoxin-like negative regulator of GroEL